MSAWLLLAALVAPARADEGDAAPAPVEAGERAPDPPGGRAAIEVIVYEEMLVEQAKKQVYEDLEQAGYTETVRKDDKTIFRHPDPWKGEVHVDDDGWMRVKRQKIQVEGREMPWAERNSPLAWAGCVIWIPLCVRPAGQTLSRKKFAANEDRIVRWAQDDVDEWGNRIADLAVKRKIDSLPSDLEALWAEGRPIDGEGPTLATHAERRRHLMEYWASRTETIWGQQVRESVAAFCRGVIQHSEHPFTEAEISAFNDGRSGLRSFSLERPVVAEGE